MFFPSVHNLYPDAQPGLYPPPPPANPPEGYQYQDYFGGSEQPPYGHHGRWPGQAAPSEAGPLHYHDDADCITFLRGCLAGLCCCCLLEQC
ncbi:hypothetical protein HU200_052936 [Digitaria exilis]|uniref:Cysteine-rich transmembrane CYSTM domain-containing protein n=1 Tax=Digitaria exilis TaxID=1010633 RepID=A0A835E844_9POAL|nr:hypothetical protein HU200_052936 [Digitaria exilis]